MARNTTEMERLVARTLRDSLEKLQHTTEEANQAVGDLVSACASAHPGNSLPHLLRAQTAAASLAASLDVLSRFITSAMQPGWNAPFAAPEASVPDVESSVTVDVQPAEAPAVPTLVTPEIIPIVYEPSPAPEPAAAAVEEALRAVASGTEALEQQSEQQEHHLQQQPPEPEPLPLIEPPSPVREIFEIASLPVEQQELHRRANRVAKVSMQDIKMLRPGDVKLGKENNDLCSRLRDDVERAHKEYERRFHAILDHPVDYFYAWMVEILGEGDPRALGEYPYPSPVVRH